MEITTTDSITTQHSDINMEQNVQPSDTFSADSSKDTNETELIIEEVSRGQKLLHRYKIAKNTITVGRGYQNDIILSDPHICPNHLALKFDGNHWHIHDLNTINGTQFEDGKQNADNHLVQSGDLITLGKSQIRLVFPEHPVEETVALSTFESFINFMRHPLALFISMAFFTLIAGTLFYLNKPTEVNFSQLFVPAIGMTLLFALWPGGVALVSHLSKSEARIMAQLGVSFAFFNLMWLSDVLESLVSFNSSSNFPLAALITLIPIALAFCLFWLNSYIGFHMSGKRRIVVSIAITTLLFGGSYLVQYSNKPEFNPRPQYNATLMTPTFLISSSSSVDKFIEDSSKVFDKASKKALEE